MKGRIPLAQAQRVAWGWTRRLAPYCKRIEVAGSVRRKRETVGDIEIVAIPKPGEPEQLALIPGAPHASKRKQPPLFERIHDLSNSRNGTLPILIMKGATGLLNGKARYIQIHDKNEDIYLDLFLATPESWGIIFAIRTGSAEFSHALMVRANQRGLTSHQGRFTPMNKFTYNPAATQLETPEERDVFNALHIEWVEPPMRRGFSDVKHSSRRCPQGEDGQS